MILTVTLNAAIDRTYQIAGFQLDRVHRPERCWIVAGGKGINVARTAHRLGGSAFATGILAGHNGRFIRSSLQEEGIPGEFVWVRGESRTCIAAVDPMRRSQTEINEVGPIVPPRAMERLHRLADRLLASGRFQHMALSGSVPPGASNDVYARLTELARRRGVRVVLDSSSEPLVIGSRARPWLIKPNLLELSQLTGERPATAAEVRDVARRLLGAGTEAVIVTMGAAGCVCVTSEEAFHARTPEVPFISAVGSGDALLGALLVAVERGQCWRDAVRFGVAAGAANACEYGAGFVDPERVQSLFAQATVEEI